MLLGMTSFGLYAQDGIDTGAGDPDALSSEASNFNFPVSPEAGHLGLYGKLPVNLSTGKLGKQVPLYTFELGKYSWPVTLSYNYSGLLLEDKPSISGLGWSMTGEGVVTREVRGLPDEHTHGYYKEHIYQDKLLPFFTEGIISFHDAKDIVEGVIDSEPDVYHVSVNGMNFSFKRGLDGQPVFLSLHNYKVIMDRNGDQIEGFTVIDDRGISYEFYAQETNSPIGGNQAVFNDNFPSYTSAWKLTKVSFPNNRELNFVYSIDQYTSVDFGAQGVIYSHQVNCNFVNTPRHSYSEHFSTTNIQRQILQSISSSYSTAHFNISGSGNDLLYSGLQVSWTVPLNNEAPTTTSAYNYVFSYAGDRNVLTQIDKNGFFYYGFEYRGGGHMPGFFTEVGNRPYAQDRWGFYNGQVNTSALRMPGTPYQADKSSSFTNTARGALSRITYPTGGSTTIDYEPNTISHDSQSNGQAGNAPAFNMRLKLRLMSDYLLYGNTNNYHSGNYPDTKTEEYTLSFSQPTYASLSHTIEAELLSNTTISISRNQGYGGYQGCDGPVPDGSEYSQLVHQLRNGEEIPQICLQLGYHINDQGPDIPGSGNIIIDTGDTEGVFLIAPGNYTFKIETTKNNTRYVNGRIDLNFYRPPSVDSETGEAAVIGLPVGGIRVSKTTDYPAGGGPPIVKNYKYVTPEGLPSGVLLQQGTNYYINDVEYCCRIGGSTTTTGDTELLYFERANFSYKTYEPLNLNQGQPVFYTSVLEYDKITTTTAAASRSECDPSDPDCLILDPASDSPLQCIGDCHQTNDIEVLTQNYSNGYRVTSFELPRYFQQEGFPVVPNGRDQSMGRVLRQQTYTYLNGNPQLQSQTDQQYIERHPDIHSATANIADGNHPYSLKIANKLVREGSCFIIPPDDQSVTNSYYTYATYKEYDTYFQPTESSSLSVSDNGRTMQSQQSNTYDDRRQLKTTTTINSSGEELKQELFYPYDLNVQNVFNNISEVVGSKTFIDNQEVSYTRTDYAQALNETPSTVDLVVPSVVSSSVKGNSLEANMQYTRYDDYGNVLEYTVREEGYEVVTSILYGYGNQYPIAKIENADYTSVLNALSVSSQELQGYTGSYLEGIFSSLRAALPGALITSYTYLPLIGVSSITESRQAIKQE